MVDIWTYEIAVFEETPVELTGWDVEASDGHIGKIDEASTAAGDSYIVVDTGFWIFGKRRLIPARMISRIDLEDQKVWIDLNKEEVKLAPDYDEAMRTDQEWREETTNFYSRYARPGRASEE